ncbi:MAG: transketolase C-terminal domain-containing protein [Opitutaceae bacterium]|nr:transketolase C-terminal domain-containing protein [Opitutaceae bacterium]
MNNQREVYGRTLVELGKSNSRIVVLEADLGKSTMSCYFEKAFPKRYFEMGIAEQNMTSFGAGLSLTGKIVFLNTFAVFASGRAFDQIRQGIAIGRLNVKIVGSSAGLSDFGDGATHQSVEDLAIMRAIPNMTVLAPMDADETKAMTEWAAAYDGPVYLRLNRNDMPDYFPAGKKFEVGQPQLVREGRDAVVFANGLMVSRAMAAADALAARGVSLRVVNVSSLKPLDEAAVRQLALGMRAIVTAEEHNIIGGVGDAVNHCLRGSGIALEMIGMTDVFGQSAHSYEELLNYYGLTSKNIVEKVAKLLSK